MPQDLAKQSISLWARRMLGESVNPEMIDWACQMLAAGHDSKHLRWLAGCSEKDSSEEILDYFQKAALECGFRVPPPSESVRAYADFVCQSILDNELDAEIGHRLLNQVWIAERGRDYNIWVHLADSRELVKNGYAPLLPECRA